MSISRKQHRYFRLAMNSGVLRFLGVLSLVFLCGCGLFQSRKKPHIEEIPPYYQQSRANTEIRSYHDYERENMANQVHVVRNREMERLINSENEEKKEQQWENEIKTNQEKQTNFWDKFKIHDKNFLRSDEAVRISSNLDR
ncbi:MAG: hypothetical protein LBP87_00890 [Planctomycetaceae bacterium]|nr:hypothetical protein [Planctomycetaceae bacterium]